MKPLLEQQQEAKSHLHNWKVGALFMEAGTGKTRVAVEIVNASPCDAVFWFAPLRTIHPKSDVLPVTDEINKWGGFQMPTYFYGVESISASDRIFMEAYNLVKSFSNPFVVVDESLKIKNAEAKRTKRLLQIGEIVQYKLILNGTPLSRDLLDLWSQMEFISPKILNMNLRKFKNTFCRYTTVTKYLTPSKCYSKEFITGYENIDYLYSLIRHYVFEADLSLNITQNYTDIHYAVDDTSKSDYYYLKERFLDDEMLMWKNNNIFLEMTQKMQHAYCCTPEKFKKVDDLFHEIPQDKSIIFCKYVSSRLACERRYPKALVLSYQKDAFGLNLQERPYTVYFDKIWDYALRTQSTRRNYRVGQEMDCKYYDLTGDVGLESLIDRNIDKKVGMTEYFKSATKKQLEAEL